MGITTFDEIQQLSEEQQHLWRKADKHRLTSKQRTRLLELKPKLARLWHVYRCELARARTSDPMADAEALYHSQWFADFFDRLHDGVRAQYDDIEDVPYIPDDAPTPRELFWVDVVEILREVRAEMEIAQQHRMRLVELLAKRGLTLRWELGQQGRMQPQIVRIGTGG